MCGDELDNLSEEEIEEGVSLFCDYFIESIFERMMAKLTEDEQQNIYKYMELHPELEPAWQKAMVVNEYMFRASSIRMAQCYSDATGDGKTYMYLFCKTHSEYDCIGACHAYELSYVFHNLNYSSFSGVTDEALADKICGAWVNFAKTGDPSIENFSWTEYDTDERNTMVVSSDGSMDMVSDPLSEERKLSEPLQYVTLNGGNGV